MMKFFAIVALAMFATTNASSVADGVITRPGSSVQGKDGGNLVITFKVGTGTIVSTDTVKFTPGENAGDFFTADGTDCSCTATPAAITGVAGTPVKSTGVLSMVLTTSGAIAATTEVVITCTANLAVNAAAGAKTFALETTKDSDSVAATGYTITAGFKDFTATRASLVTGVAPGNLVVTLTPLILIGNSGATPAGTITLTPSKQFFDGNTAGGTATTCTVVTDPVTGAVPELTAAVTGHGTAQVLTLSMGSKVTDTIAVDEVATITCTGNMAVVNGAAASTVTFAVKTSGDATGLTAQAGYLIASASAASATAGVSMLTMLALAGVAMRQ